MKKLVTIYLGFFIFFMLSSCSKNPGERMEDGWHISGKMSVKLSSRLDYHYSSMDTTGLTHGLPKLLVDFDLRNDSGLPIALDYLECIYEDGEGRSLKQTILSKKTTIIQPGQFHKYSTDHNGWHIDVENCKFLIKVYSSDRIVSKFAIDISHKLDPEVSAREKIRRQKIDEFDRARKNSF